MYLKTGWYTVYMYIGILVYSVDNCIHVYCPLLGIRVKRPQLHKQTFMRYLSVLS